MRLTFVHVTSKSKLASIAAGLRKGTYLVHANQDAISDYYAETVVDEGDEPVVIEIDPSGIIEEHLAPDSNGIEEPLTVALRMSEEEVREIWESGEQTWQACVDLIGTCRHMAVVAPHFLRFNGEPLAAPAESSAKASRQRMRP